MAIEQNSRLKAKRQAAGSPTPKPAIGRKKATRVDDRKSQIMLISAQLFSEYGFEATSMRQIADEADMLAGSIYHQVPTKEHILHSIIRELLRVSSELHEYSYGMPVNSELKFVTSIIKRVYDYIYSWEAHAVVEQNSLPAWIPPARSSFPCSRWLEPPPARSRRPR